MTSPRDGDSPRSPIGGHEFDGAASGSTRRVPSWCSLGRRPRVAVMGPPDREDVIQEWRRLRATVVQDSEIIVEDFRFEHDYQADPVDASPDLVIVLGGDGSILQCARQLGCRQCPVLGINCGRLGFLAALSPDDFLDAWPKLCTGEFSIVEHVMLFIELIRDHEVVASQFALNDAAVMAGRPFRILDIDLFADGEWATRYRCDGLIVATPVGSTAHNLSAGGPILRRNLPAVVISPISPHTLTVRPLVDSADTVFELTVTEPYESTSIVVDGRVLGDLIEGDRVRIQRADFAFEMVSVPGQNDYRTLRDKLGWSGSFRLRS
ncbi:MAG: NAD(+)/NADH kinase [Planctomycetota bacterium]